MTDCETHEIIESTVLNGPQIKATDANGNERWATVQRKSNETIYCPYCGNKIQEE